MEILVEFLSGAFFVGYSYEDVDWFWCISEGSVEGFSGPNFPTLIQVTT